MIEAVVNVSEGRDESAIALIGATASQTLLDVHSDLHHNRSVFTLAGEPEEVERDALSLSREAVSLLDISAHEGVHPRLGVVDVVPFVPYGSGMGAAVETRDRYSRQFGADGIPCFRYGPERSLPEIRRQAFRRLLPDTGPPRPHPTAGATSVGARNVLVAYNLFVEASLETAREIARELRSTQVRALGFPVGAEAQVSFNLVEPDAVGPEQVFDEVARLVPVKRAELVGLIPARLLDRIPSPRHAELGLSESATIEGRLSEARRS